MLTIKELAYDIIGIVFAGFACLIALTYLAHAIENPHLTNTQIFLDVVELFRWT